MNFTTYGEINFGHTPNGAPTFHFTMPGWSFERKFEAMKTLKNGQTGAIEGYAFLVQDSDYVDGDIAPYINGSKRRSDFEEAGWEMFPTYSVWTIKMEVNPTHSAAPKRPRVTIHYFEDFQIINNWDFAYAMFVRLFGCFVRPSDAIKHNDRDDTFTPCFLTYQVEEVADPDNPFTPYVWAITDNDGNVCDRFSSQDQAVSALRSGQYPIDLYAIQ